jgi:5'-3' exonuclease
MRVCLCVCVFVRRRDRPKENVRDLCQKYLESLVWVLEYYYAGCTSWKWFFPYRYGAPPSASASASALSCRAASAACC